MPESVPVSAPGSETVTGGGTAAAAKNGSRVHTGLRSARCRLPLALNGRQWSVTGTVTGSAAATVTVSEPGYQGRSGLPRCSLSLPSDADADAAARPTLLACLAMALDGSSDNPTIEPVVGMPPTSPLTDGFLWFFAPWTILCNAVALGGGGLRFLVWAAAGTGLLAAGCALIRRQSLAAAPPGQPHRRAVGTGDTQAVRRAFALLVIASVAATLLAHRPDHDDAAFLNWAVTAADCPDLPLYQPNRTTSIPGARELLPVRRAQSIEMLAAATAWLGGVEPITLMHLVFPPLGALLLCLAHRELMRLLAPRVWLLGVGLAIAFLLLDGGTHHSWGNFAMVRLHQGKSVLVSALVPLVMAAAVRFMRRPEARSWLRLGAVQIAAIGMSANGLWLAPAVAGLSLVAAGVAGRNGFRAAATRVVAGVSASAYPLVLAACFRSFWDFPGHLTTVSTEGLALLASGLSGVVGQAAFGVATAGLVLLAAVWGAGRSSASFTRTYLVCWALLFANPWTAPWIAANVTGAEVHWRVFWALPVPVFVALGALAPVSAPPWMRHPFRARALSAVLAATMVATGWSGHVLRPDNHTRLTWPGLKTDPEFAVARRLRDLLGPDVVLLGPTRVTAWVVTLRHHPIPLLARAYHGRLHGDEGAHRRAVKQHISGGPRLSGGLGAFAHALELYRVDAVCLPLRARRASDDRSVLVSEGFRKIETFREFEFWVRDDPETDEPAPTQHADSRGDAVVVTSLDGASPELGCARR